MYRRRFCIALILCMTLFCLSGCESTQKSNPTQPEATSKQTEMLPTTENLPNLAAKYTRLSDEPIPELRAADDYGFIVPFLASAPDFMACGPAYGSYGFMDANGRIVADPVYQYIDALCVEDGYAFEGCVWLLAQGEVHEESAYSYHSYLADGRYGLAKRDGSVVVNLMYDDIEVLGNHIFAKKYVDDTYEKIDVDIYNFNCERIATSRAWNTDCGVFPRMFCV